MAIEPFNIFSHRIDVRGVLAVLRKAGLELTVEGPEDDWTQVVVLGPKKFLRKRARLVIGHNAEFYDGPGWAGQVAGMGGFFGRFPDVPRKNEILRVIRSFRFVLAFPEADLDITSADERVAWVRAICRQLDGVIFTPSGLRDSAGRILISGDADSDPRAVLPAIPSFDDHPQAADEDDSAEDETEQEPPDAQRVARRALVLAAVANRGLIENEHERFEKPDEIRNLMLSWIQDVDLADEPEPEEWKALQRPVGKLEMQAALNGVWRLEGLGVLLWALGKYELPVYDQLVLPQELFEAVHMGDAEAARQFVAEAELKSAAELTDMQTQALALHWRLRDFSLRPEPMDFVAFSQNCWFGKFDLAPFRILEQDLAIGENPIAEADSEQLQTCESSAQERHLAINWLLGYSKLYSETDTST